MALPCLTPCILRLGSSDYDHGDLPLDVHFVYFRNNHSRPVVQGRETKKRSPGRIALFHEKLAPSRPQGFGFPKGRGPENQKKSAPGRILRLGTWTVISKYALYDDLVRLCLAHGALSLSGATRFAIMGCKEIRFYFLPPSCEVPCSCPAHSGCLNH